MENNQEMVTTTETVENNSEEVQEQKKEEKTYTRAELNKIISAEREKVKAELKKEAEEQKTEAEKLAKMDADEKHKYELEKANKEKEDALSKLNSYELKDQALKIAKEKDMDISLLEILDYSKETADSIKTKIESIDETFKKAVEKGINEKLKEKSPKYVANGLGNPESDYLKNKYKNNPYFKG